MKNDNISVIITVYNKQGIIGETIKSLISQPVNFKEIFVIDDGSSDNSPKIIKDFAAKYKNIKYVSQNRRGVAEALNTGIKMSSGDFIAVLDGDVILDKDWILKLMPYFDNEKIGAVSGLTKLGNPKNFWPALSGYNVEFRQSIIGQEFVDHLSTCNTIYRKSALDKVGLFDGRFIYGQDNELSYRMIEGGYKLVLSKKTFCLHFWPESFKSFMKQRSHGALGRMLLIQKHPKRWSGDKVSSFRYFMELPLGLLFLLFLIASLISRFFLIFAGLVMIVLYFYQLDEIKVFFKKKKIALGIFLPFFSLLKSLAWISGIIKYYFSKK